MNRALRNRFPPFVDKQSLRTAIEQVCAEFGTVTKLEIFPARREQVLQCACFLRLDSDAAVARLKAKCQVHQLGNDIAFFAEVDEGWTGETM